MEMTETIIEIIQRNYKKFTGTNEAELHAAEEIAELIETREGFFKIHQKVTAYFLERLADFQNGPPLERERKEWESLMKEIRQHLKESK
jgi:hypothetical protein